MSTHELPPPAAEALIEGLLSELAGVDTHDVNLRDHKEAWDAVDRFVTAYTRTALATLTAEVESAKKDAERWRWLAPRLMAADFDWQGEGHCVLVFDWPRGVAVGGDCAMNVDAAITAANEGEGA